MEYHFALYTDISVSQQVESRSWNYINFVHYYLKTLSSSLKKRFPRWCSNNNTVLNLTVANSLLQLLWIWSKYQKESNVQSSRTHRTIAFLCLTIPREMQQSCFIYRFNKSRWCQNNLVQNPCQIMVLTYTRNFYQRSWILYAWTDFIKP